MAAPSPKKFSDVSKYYNFLGSANPRNKLAVSGYMRESLEELNLPNFPLVLDSVVEVYNFAEVFDTVDEGMYF